jgi:hypothetical protein
MLFWSSLLGHARLTLLCCAQRGSKASQGITWKEAQENRGSTTLYTQQQVRRRVFLRPSLSPRLCFYFWRHMMASENCCCTMILRPPVHWSGGNKRETPPSLPPVHWVVDVWTPANVVRYFTEEKERQTQTLRLLPWCRGWVQSLYNCWNTDRPGGLI